jgi:hypothetical protein
LTLGLRFEISGIIYLTRGKPVSAKHFDRYLDEFEFRFNNRNNPYLFRDTLLRLVTSENLKYKELTKEEAA